MKSFLTPKLILRIRILCFFKFFIMVQEEFKLAKWKSKLMIGRQLKTSQKYASSHERKNVALLDAYEHENNDLTQVCISFVPRDLKRLILISNSHVLYAIFEHIHTMKINQNRDQTYDELLIERFD